MSYTKAKPHLVTFTSRFLEKPFHEYLQMTEEQARRLKKRLGELARNFVINGFVVTKLPKRPVKTESVYELVRYLEGRA